MSIEKKGSKKLQVSIVFRNPNITTLKDECHMPIANMLINDVFGHRIIRFLDGNTGLIQILMAEEDMSKMAFKCPGLFVFWVGCHDF